MFYTSLDNIICHDMASIFCFGLSLQMFGREAVKQLDYIECFPNGYKTGIKMDKACLNSGIEGFPTWVINGQVSTIIYFQPWGATDCKKVGIFLLRIACKILFVCFLDSEFPEISCKYSSASRDYNFYWSLLIGFIPTLLLNLFQHHFFNALGSHFAILFLGRFWVES